METVKLSGLDLLKAGLFSAVLCTPIAASSDDSTITKYIGACATTAKVASALLGQRATEHIASFGRYAGKNTDGVETYKFTMLTANKDRTEWYLIFSDSLDLSGNIGKDERLCVNAAGSAIEILDPDALRKAYDNPSGIKSSDGGDVPQGWAHHFSRKKQRETWNKLAALRRTPSGKNPNETAVLGFVFDFRQSAIACAAAKARWQSDSCETYEEEMHTMADLISAFPVLQGRGADSDKRPFLMTVVINKKGQLRILKTEPQGGTIYSYSGTGLTLFGWAKSATGISAR